MDETNGNSKSRLDRMEGLLEVLVDEHVKFDEEHKKLLMAQVVLTDRLDKLTVRVDRLAVTMQELAEAQSVLMHTMDDFIRGRGDRGPREN